MTDEEIWECMQRDLDGDLSPEEKRQLHDLLLKKPSMQLMYDRLKKVSEQLEQLPPVTPRFSIVDTILPQLESEKVRPAAAAGSEKEILPKLEPKQLTAKTSPVHERRKWNRVTLWTARIGSGVVAASLLIGLVVMGNPASSPDEDEYRQGTSVQPPEEVQPAVVGPPTPPPSNNLSQPIVPEEEKEQSQKEQPVKRQTPKQKTTPVKQQQQQVPAKTQKPDPNVPKPPPKPAVKGQDEKPAFPYGVAVPDEEEKKKEKEKKEKEKEKQDKKKDDDDDQDDRQDKDKDDED
ncbi:anti-sigma factor family protein [Brevibacillus borstelensis]|uniref:anti-sigma factor family protein n=1 Tax=Brevibacillus borstelensis TaxID=45462 RepID=UPI00287FE13C|nr:hypothetical protein [Brevibacillus borstelensis]MED1874081.1 hypothetical protein [Brevibacillus borstelensis]WNF04082.1 hypothetical protein RFB14_16910 [Brevibacillus borstelensis]